MAHRKLGVALSNAGMPREKRDAALTKAYQYRDRLTERERYLAIASYFDDGPGYDRQRAAAAYEALLERDSLDDVAMNNLGDVFGRRREFARQESLYRRAIVSGVAGPGEYGKMVWTRINQGRLAGAESSLADARSAFPADPLRSELEALLLYARDRVDSAAAHMAQVRASESDPIARVLATYRLAAVAMLDRVEGAPRAPPVSPQAVNASEVPRPARR